MSVKRSFDTHLIPRLLRSYAATQLPQSSKYSKSADLLRKSLLSHIWRVPSSKDLSCKHKQLFDLLTLVSYALLYHKNMYELVDV